MFIFRIFFIINLDTSITSNKFPITWQNALVLPTPKKCNPTTYKDLRPVSILPCFSKILEKIVYIQLIDYLESSKILPELQSGFRRQRGTATALLDVVDSILGSQDRGMATALVLLDYSRAFDTINIQLMLTKLNYYGFSQKTVQWFGSYLGNRTQTIAITRDDGGVTFSKCSSINRGIPQGSILGPILFILYTADLINQIKFCKYHLYADDVQLYFSFNPNETTGAILKINSDLTRISDWSEQNTLVLNADKTKYMLIGTPKQLKKIEHHSFQLNINGVLLDRVKEARNLGILFDEYLRFEKHVNTIVANCFYRLKLLYRIRNYINPQLRLRLCESLVLSKFNYADVMYGPRLLSRTKNAIQRVQNACARVGTFLLDRILLHI